MAQQSSQESGVAAVNKLSQGQTPGTSARGCFGMLFGDKRQTNAEIPVREDWHQTRVTMATVIELGKYKFLMGLTIIVNMVLMVEETDHRARMPGGVPAWMETCSSLFLSVYVVDLGMKIYVWRAEFFTTFMNALDFIVVLVDLLCMCLALIIGSDLPSVAVLRTLRILRIVKVLHGVLIFRELYLMMQGLVSALRSIAFGTVLIGVVLTIWSMLAVPLLNNVNRKLALEGQYGDCSTCAEAFSTVMMSNLTFMKTIVAGDSWGQIALPLLDEYPLAALIIIPVFISVQLGLVNVVAAVIVDRQAQARVDDESLTHIEHFEELNRSYSRLQAMFQKMDVDGGGSLSLRELIDSYDEREDFRTMLEMMDITKDDLPLVFNILDADGSGDVTYQEFVEKLHYIRYINPHTLLVFIKMHVDTLTRWQGDSVAKLRDMAQAMRDLEQRVHTHLAVPLPAPASTTAAESSLSSPRCSVSAFGDRGAPGAASFAGAASSASSSSYLAGGASSSVAASAVVPRVGPLSPRQLSPQRYASPSPREVMIPQERSDRDSPFVMATATPQCFNREVTFETHELTSWQLLEHFVAPINGRFESAKPEVPPSPREDFQAHTLSELQLRVTQQLSGCVAASVADVFKEIFRWQPTPAAAAGPPPPSPPPPPPRKSPCSPSPGSHQFAFAHNLRDASRQSEADCVAAEKISWPLAGSPEGSGVIPGRRGMAPICLPASARMMWS